MPEAAFLDVPSSGSRLSRRRWSSADSPSACASARCCGSPSSGCVLVYLPVCHWVWGGGWLAKLGVVDFAGGIVVHVNAGVAALVRGARAQRAAKAFRMSAMASARTCRSQSSGAGMLWVGWYGFNGGSALAANGSASMAILVTHLGAATGALAWMALEWWPLRKAQRARASSPGWLPGSAPSRLRQGFVGPIGGVVIGVDRRRGVLLRPLSS